VRPLASNSSFRIGTSARIFTDWATTPEDRYRRESADVLAFCFVVQLALHSSAGKPCREIPIPAGRSYWHIHQAERIWPQTRSRATETQAFECKSQTLFAFDARPMSATHFVYAALEAFSRPPPTHSALDGPDDRLTIHCAPDSTRSAADRYARSFNPNRSHLFDCPGVVQLSRERGQSWIRLVLPAHGCWATA
jgi:hypothetical protein